MKSVHAESKTTCEEVALFLGLLVDGEISGEDLARIEVHLSGCATCRRERARLEDMKAVLRGLEHEGDAPPALLLRVKGDVQRARAKERKSQSALVFGAMLSLVGFGALAGALVVDREQKRPDPIVRESFERHTLDVPVDLASHDAARVERFVSARVPRPIRVPALDGLGLELAGARIVNVERTLSAQLVYRSALGERLSVTAIPDPTGALHARVTGPLVEHGVDEGGLHLRTRDQDGVVYTAVASLPDDVLARALDAFAR